MANIETLLADTRYWVEQGSAPSTPASGSGVTYFKNDGKFYAKNDGGTEYDLTSGAGAGSVIPNLFVGSAAPYLATTASTALTANRAYLAKFIPTQDVTVTTAYWSCVTSAGNLDFGIYNADFSSRLASTGSFASPGTGARSQVFAASGSVAMVAGTIYYLAFTASSTSLRIPQLTLVNVSATGGWNVYGREETALPLPSSIVAVDAWEDATVFPLFYFK